MYHAVNKTHLMSFVTRVLLTYASITFTYVVLHKVGNTTLYGTRRFLQTNVLPFPHVNCGTQ